MKFSTLPTALSLSAVLVADALDYPMGITNCGVQSWIQEPPERALTMNQGTTEVMLALGLADRMVGTAYIDDYIWPELVSLPSAVLCLPPRTASAHPPPAPPFRTSVVRAERGVRERSRDRREVPHPQGDHGCGP